MTYKIIVCFDAAEWRCYEEPDDGFDAIKDYRAAIGNGDLEEDTISSYGMIREKINYITVNGEKMDLDDMDCDVYDGEPNDLSCRVWHKRRIRNVIAEYELELENDFEFNPMDLSVNSEAGPIWYDKEEYADTKLEILHQSEGEVIEDQLYIDGLLLDED